MDIGVASKKVSQSNETIGVECVRVISGVSGSEHFQRRNAMGQGGDRGKGPNKTGTQPTGGKKSPSRGSKKPGKGGEGQGSAKSRAAGPKNVAADTTKRSRDK